jgi:hypothetical protein
MTRGCRTLVEPLTAQSDISSSTLVVVAAMNGKGNIAVYAHIMLLILASSMYELKKILELYLRVNFLGPGPSCYKKRIYQAAVSQSFCFWNLQFKVKLFARRR